MRGVLASIFRYNQFHRDEWVAAEARKVAAGSKVLDVGAGAGPYRDLFAHCEYRAHDFGREPGTIGSYTALDYESDILSIPAPAAAFDAILCTEVLEHVPEPARALVEMARLLRRDGRLLLTAPLGSRLHQEPYHFYGGFTPAWFRKFLPVAGFRIESLERNGGFFRLFGQEAMYWSACLDPRRTRGRGVVTWVGTTCLWLTTLPFTRLMAPVLAPWLDELGIEATGTAGYHVVATRT
ncbi:MAG: methyltransferase domain-containing protein [Thermoanaerobaculia bacterium]|jgi:SAM-dependent methyltransferase